METFDYETQFEKVKKDVALALSKTLDIQSDQTGLRLKAKDITIEDNADSSDWESQREAVRKDKTWGVPVYGTIELTDRKTGRVISVAKRVKLATLPKPTDFGSFIVDGKHYQVQNQFRRKPGIYITQSGSGEGKTEINIAGRPFDVEFDPKDSKFKIVLKQGDSKKSAPLYPVLSRLGISDSVLAKTWGEDVLAKNKAINPKAAADAVNKVAEYFAGESFDSPDAAAKAIAAYLEENAEVKPEVTAQTIGKPFSKVTPEAIVIGSKELLRLVNHERDVDDRNALQFKKAFALSDIMRERFLKPNGELSPYMNELRAKIARKLNNQRNPPTNVSQLVTASQFTPALTSFFTKTDLSSTTDQTNPINMLNGMSKVTILGEGGVSDPQRVRDEEHALHPSHLGFIDPVHTPDSEKIGLVLNLPVGVSKRGDELETAVLDLKTGTTRRITPSEAATLTVAFPDQYVNGKPIASKVKAIARGEERLVDPSEVDVVLRTARQAFSISSNTIPFIPAIAGVRAQMATKMLEQAIPLKEREAPRVQVKLGNETIEQAIGSGFSIRALADGVVKSVDKNRIIIDTGDGEVEQSLYSNLPLNSSFVDAEPRVKPGDTVKKGDVIADSNFTKDGTLAIGTNLKAAYIPWKGYNFEDGIVITESAAKKLTSVHMHQHAYTPTAGRKLGLEDYLAWKPNGIDLEAQSKLDNDGVVKKGAILKKGDPLWVGVRDVKMDDLDAIALRRLGGRPEKQGFEEIWTSDYPGEVVDVVRVGKKVKVFVKTQEPAQIGDKLTNRHAAKGIITKIIPDGMAPRTADGEPVDILLNPQGIPGRINPSQILETAAAKLAKVDEQGRVIKPFVVDNSNPGPSLAKTVHDQISKAGLSDTEELFDPQTGKSLGHVLTGPQYVLKLSKQATSQFSARSPLDGTYDTHGNPSEGGEKGAKALDLISFYSMLSHGARANLQEMATFKATNSPQFWDWLVAGSRSGLIKPQPEPTAAYKKFEAYLKAAGVNVKRGGATNSALRLQPLTDKDVEKLSNGPLQEPVFVKAKNLEEERGGLMDPQIFGGRQGDKWGHIDLAEPIPNPLFETPIKTLTGLKDSQYNGFVQGKLWLNPKTGEMGAGPEFEEHPDTVTSGNAIKALLSKIDIDKEFQFWTEKAKTATSPAKLNEAHKKLKYLAALRKLKIRPEEAYVQSKIPVLPPKFRPVIAMEDGTLSNAGLNTLYRDLALVNNELKWQNNTPFIPESLGPGAPGPDTLRAQLYEGVKALAGLGDPIAYYPGSRKPKGIIEQLKGSKAKEGFFQYNVLRRRQEPVGRGTIIPEPKLGLDEVGLPEEMAWTIFEPFVMRRLVTQTGMSPIDAGKEIENRTESARAALEAEMNERPVMLNRAPSLHKFSIMAFKPQITDGRAIKIPPLVVKGFGADFDGDTMTVHVPVLPDAVKEAEKMLPSKNLFNPGSGAVMIQPQNEAALGLYLMSRNPNKRQELLSVLPPEVRERHKNAVLDKDGLRKLMDDLARTAPNDYGRVVDKLKSLGDEHTYQIGFTVSLKDLIPKIPERDQIFQQAKKVVLNAKLDNPKTRNKVVELLQEADKELKKAIDKRLAEQGNNLHLMVSSGSRGSPDQLKQIVSAPLLVDDHRGRKQPIPVLRSFAEGLPLSDYWSTLYGARAAATDKQLQTSEPGAFNKSIMAASINNVVSTDDCHTNDGVEMSITGPSSRDLTERFLATDIRVNGTTIARAGDQISASLLNTLRDRKINTIKVRSPLTCRAPKGTCSKCYGLDERGNLPEIGTNVGAIAGQAISEPLTQMTLRTIHGGGVAGTRTAVEGYEKIDKLFKMHELKQGKATLARRDGKITRIEDIPGGKNVYIDDEKTPHFIEKDLWEEGKLRVGTTVRKGDMLSAGIVQPQELVKLKGMLPAQEYIAEQIHDAFDKQGVKLKRKIVETVVRSVGNTTKILDPGDSPFIPGDVVPWTVVQDYNNKPVGEVPLDEAIGHTLLEDIPGAKKGEPITDRVKLLLQRLGKQKVKVGPKPIADEPFLAGIEQIPMLRKDWMSQMGYRKIKGAIMSGASEAWESELHGYDPVPAYAYGAEFGDAPGGRSKKEGVY